MADFRRSGTVEALVGDAAPREAVREDGKHALRVEPPTQDLRAGVARRGARRGRCPQARSIEAPGTKTGRKSPAAGQKVARPGNVTS
jgi:hypothetical protein